MAHWLVKEEPAHYSFADLQRDGRATWTGVRNFQARNHLRAMRKGDRVLYYHTGDEKAAVGECLVARPAFPDPSAKEGDWVAVELRPSQPLPRPVTLAEAKADPVLRDSVLVKAARLSVQPLTEAQYQRFLALARKK
ncbi:MAG: EVE domain-containing protein [Planctomycetota bacterium]|nr:MAG: EVE domain-containing protein [Planctomycetota bacterium]